MEVDVAAAAKAVGAGIVEVSISDGMSAAEDLDAGAVLDVFVFVLDGR